MSNDRKLIAETWTLASKNTFIIKILKEILSLVPATSHDGITGKVKLSLFTENRICYGRELQSIYEKLLDQYVTFFQLHAMPCQYTKINRISTHRQLEFALNKIHLE